MNFTYGDVIWQNFDNVHLMHFLFLQYARKEYIHILTDRDCIEEINLYPVVNVRDKRY